MDTDRVLKLFQSVFGGGEKKGHYPESLIKAVIERTVDGTDPRMRILPGYAKTLRKPVLHTIEHIMSLVENLQAPLLATQTGHQNSPLLGTLFISVTRMYEIFNNDKALREYLSTSPPSGTLTGLLVVQRHEKQGFGYGLVDDKLVSDVQQTTVSFDQHRLVDISANEEETRRLLKRRALDYLLSIALAHVGDQQDARKKLSEQRSLLKIKLDILQKGGGGFSGDDSTQDRSALQARLEQVENQLNTLGPAQEVLQENLKVVTSILENAEKHFWSEEKILQLNQHGVLSKNTASSTPAISCHDLCDSSGRRVTALIVNISPDELPQRSDLSAFLKSHS